MHMFLKGIRGLVYIGLLAVCSCSSNNQAVPTAVPAANIDLNNFKFTVEEAPEWTNLFKRTRGWFGGDGIFVIPQSGGDNGAADTSTIVFSDTMIGEIIDGKLKPGYAMIHNSVATINGKEPTEEKIKFHCLIFDTHEKI